MSETDGARRLILVADPGLPADIVRSVCPDLPDRLDRELATGVTWHVDTVTTPLVTDDETGVDDIADAVEAQMEDENWDVGIFLTDLPRRARLETISAEIDASHRVALVSLPALGFRRLRPRVKSAVVGITGRLLPEAAEPDDKLRVIGHWDHGPGHDTGSDRCLVPGLRGHIRLIAGMVRANRPWQLFTSLSRALAGVFATAAISFLNSTTWQVALELSAWQQTVITVLSTVALTVWIIVDHGLWERPGDHLPGRHNALYPYNLITFITIALGVISLYAVLYLTLAAVSFLILDPTAFDQIARQSTGPADHFWLAWFVASISIVGGAFGTGLEADEAVRNAAYGRRHHDRQRQMTEGRRDRA
ncbi:hypothetical protein ABZT04_32435 [Streptomyces sp. NPDC005492]|uniref:hypothetical protein n=1 Tax=Streptomyces sp. NPDC005492 TaxID=3156883 RepID=UPI0033ACC575